MTKFTKEQSIIVTGFTGCLTVGFCDFHADVERRMGRKVFTHEFSAQGFEEQLKELYRQDFLALIPEGI